MLGLPRSAWAILILWSFCCQVGQMAKYILMEAPQNNLASCQCKQEYYDEVIVMKNFYRPPQVDVGTLLKLTPHADL